MFAQVVKGRFAKLYWEDDLLGLLHCLVNYSSATRSVRSTCVTFRWTLK